MSEKLDDAAVVAAEDAAFASGFEEKPDPKRSEKPAEPAAKPEPEAPAGATEPAPEAPPEYVQITRKDWDEVRAAAARTASYDQQFSRAFGTIGNLQKLVNGFQAQTPAGRKVEIPRDAFAAMERDFPELAAQTRGALEAALAGVNGTGAAADVDPDKITAMMASYTAKREVEALEDAYPDWRTIVGAVDISREQPPADNAFRKWLGTKPPEYQAKLNASESAAVISRAIRLFQTETKAAAKAAAAAPPARPRDDARAARIREAVQPRGDGAGTPAGKSEDDEFMEGFNSR